MIDDADKAVELVRREILRCVAARLTPDVRYAVDLSGGLDSSIIAAAAAKRGRTLRSITMFSEGNDGTERGFDRAVADHLGIELDAGSPHQLWQTMLCPAPAPLTPP